jgi:hypothetical protein
VKRLIQVNCGDNETFIVLVAESGEPQLHGVLLFLFYAFFSSAFFLPFFPGFYIF